MAALSSSAALDQVPTSSCTPLPTLPQQLDAPTRSAVLATHFSRSPKSPRGRGMFHLRRHMDNVRYTKSNDNEARLYALFKQFYPHRIEPGKPEEDYAFMMSKDRMINRATVILLDKITRFGRNPEVVDVILSSENHTQMVSRFHAEIMAEFDPDDQTRVLRYTITDRSLNGTYVNDRRAPPEAGEMYLKRGDVIKFGHANGAAYKPGEYAVGNNAEFVFTFEPAYDMVEYVGHLPDGNRIERKGPQAYMHIGAHSLLPHEFDFYSLVPKREAELSIRPLGNRVNPEQKRVEYIPTHTQASMAAQRNPREIPPNTLVSKRVNVPGLATPAYVPNMTNFDLTADMRHLIASLSRTTNLSPEETDALVARSLLQQLVPTIGNVPPNAQYFAHQNEVNNASYLNNFLSAAGLQRTVNPSEEEMLLAAMKMLSGPYLNGHIGLTSTTTRSLSTASTTTTTNPLTLPMAPFSSLSNAASVAQHRNAALAMQSLADLQNATFQQMMGISPTTSSAGLQRSTQTPVIAASPSSSSNQSMTSPTAMPPMPPASVPTMGRPATTGILSQFGGNAINQPNMADALLESFMKEADATSTPSIRALIEQKRRAVQAVAAQAVSHPPLNSNPPSVSLPAALTEETIAAIARAAKVTGTEAKTKDDSEPLVPSDSSSSGGVTDDQIDLKPVKSEAKPRRTVKKHVETEAAQKIRFDHIQETIDSVARRVASADTSLDSSIENMAIDIPEPKDEKPAESPSKPKSRRKKRSSTGPVVEDKNSAATVKSPEPVPSTSTPAAAPAPQPEPAPEAPSETESPAPKPITNGIGSPERETSSSAGSLIVEPSDDPVPKTDADQLPRDSLSPKDQPDNSEPDPRAVTHSTSSQDSDDGSFDKPPKPLGKKRDSDGTSERPRKKSNATSVKSRVYRVPRSPPPARKGPERIPGHKSNEVARLLFDLEGSYMYVARNGRTEQRERRNTNGEDDDLDSDNDDGRKVATSKRRNSDRDSVSPSKRMRANGPTVKDDATIADDRDGVSESPKINGKPGRRAKATAQRSMSPESDSDAPKRKRGRKRESTVTGSSKTDRKKKKRGRKANKVEIMKDWEPCALPQCAQPLIDTTVTWIQCDDCPKWFHVYCIFRRRKPNLNKQRFTCGCLEPDPEAALLELPKIYGEV
uniref:FHA domain-containing protein n=1 Tax=Panagrellus redivivus TaxID=6233 RepID=A0A7E4ULX5_PANRE